MDPYSYTNADSTFNPPRLGLPDDPEGAFEPSNTSYTLTVYVPPKFKLPNSFQKFLNRKPVSYKNYNPATDFRIREPEPLPCYHIISDEIPTFKTKVVKLKASAFPLDFRCAHICGKPGKEGRTCDKGCYMLTREGEEKSWLCKREDCGGHRYGSVKEDEHGVQCFGKKGERLVLLGLEQK